MKYFIQSLICVCILWNTAHSEKIDSLKAVLSSKELTDAQRLKVLDDLSWSLVNSSVNESIHFAKQGLNLSRKVKDLNYEIVFLRNIGVGYYMGDVYDTAFIYLENGLKKAIEQDNLEFICKINIAKANIYSQTSQYDSAIYYYTKALKWSDSLSLRKETGKIYHNIGIAYQRMEIMDQAIVNFEKSKKIALEINDTQSLGFLDMALSNLYMTTDHAKALHLANESLSSFRQHQNKFGEVMALLTIAQCYYKVEKFDLSFDYAMIGYEMSKNADFVKLKVESLLLLSNIFFHQKKFDQSEKYAAEAMDLDTTTSHLVSNLLSNLVISNIYLDQKSKAVDYVIKYGNHLNKFANENFQTALSEHEVKYETEKKRLRIESLEKEKRLFFILIIVSVILLITLFIYYKKYQAFNNQKNKLIEARLKSIEQEKELIAARASLAGETAERSRLAKDLHDGLGSMLSVVKFSIPTLHHGSIIAQEDTNQFNKALGLLDQSIQELRRIAHHMMPESLFRLGLRDSLADFCRTNDKVHFHHYGINTRLEANLEILIYRSVHELVSNALKHADASEINVQLIQELDRVSVTVQDNGKGFDVDKEYTSNMGLKNIKQRVVTFGGEINLFSNQQGTEIQLEFNQLKF